MKKIIIVTIAFFLSFTVKSQSEKEVYETDDFSIEYPVSWKLQTVTNSQALFAVTAPLSSDDDDFAENVNLVTQNLKGMNMNLDAYMKLNKESISTIPGGKIFLSKREKKGNREYHVLVFKGNMSNLNLKVKQLYTIKNEIAYILTFTALENEFDGYIEKGTEILESFKLK